jgi:hypothetical protein
MQTAVDPTDVIVAVLEVLPLVRAIVPLWLDVTTPALNSITVAFTVI